MPTPSVLAVFTAQVEGLPGPAPMVSIQTPLLLRFQSYPVAFDRISISELQTVGLLLEKNVSFDD